MSLSHRERGHQTQKAALVSLAVGLTIIALQLYAYFQTNALVMLASMLESVGDAIAAATAFYALRVAHRAPDKNHRWGHGKAEPLVTLGQAAFVAGSGIYFLIQSFSRLLSPEPVESTPIGITIMVISSVLILALLIYQHRVVDRTHSMSIKADFLHYMNDMLVNIVVIISLLISGMGFDRFDGAASMLISFYILFSAWKLARGAAEQLMDKEMKDEDRHIISEIILAHHGVSGMHDLRTRQSGPDVFIDAHVEMPGDLTLHDAHHITEMLEDALRRRYPTAQIILHQEPAGIEDHKLDEAIQQTSGRADA